MSTFSSLQIRRSLPVGLLAMALLLATGGAPATTTAAESTATSAADISVLIGGRVRISRLSDIDLGTWNGSGPLSGSTRMCVFHNDGGRYSITPSSAHALNGQFRVSGAGSHIPYRVDFADDAGKQFTDVSSGKRLANLQGHDRSPACQGGTNATLTVQFSEEALQAAASGSYGDTITLLVEPS